MHLKDTFHVRLRLDSVDRRSGLTAVRGWKANNECGFLAREVNSAMSLFLLRLGVEVFLQTSHREALLQRPVYESCPL